MRNFSLHLLKQLDSSKWAITRRERFWQILPIGRLSEKPLTVWFPSASFIFVVALMITASGCGNSETAEFREYEAVPEVSELEAEGKNEAPHPLQDVQDIAAIEPNYPMPEQSEPIVAELVQEEITEDEEKEPQSAPSEEKAIVMTSATEPSLPPADPNQSLEPREPKLLIPEKTFSTEGAENALRVTFDDIDLLKVLNMEPVPESAPEMFPDWLSNLDGERVLIRGFMFPTLSQTGITYFQHVRDNEICCFGRTPKVYDRIATVLAPGETTKYIQGRPFDVVGTLRIDPVYEDGEWLQLFLLEDAKVIDK